MARQCLIESGKAITECGWFWFRSATDLENKTDFPQADHVFRDLSKNGADNSQNTHEKEATIGLNPANKKRGRIIITPHFGAWELTISCIKSVENPVFMYRKPRMAAIEDVICAGRERFGAELMDISSGGIKNVLRALRDGRTVGLLPDQEPSRQNGVFAPFFGVPANTMTLLSRIGSRTGAEIILLVLMRLPKGQGYRVLGLSPFEGVTDLDPVTAARALNMTVQTCVSLNPAQYSWTYRRFRLQPDGQRRSYELPENSQPSSAKSG